jgi:hypothetical protein
MLGGFRAGKGYPMARPTRPRFPTPEAALRFYFRASELLAGRARPGSSCGQRHPDNCKQPNALCDFLALDSCFVGMDELQIWLLKELYGPDCFGVPRRTVSGVSQAAQRKFPNQHLTRSTVARSRNDALERVEEQLKKEHLM